MAEYETDFGRVKKIARLRNEVCSALFGTTSSFDIPVFVAVPPGEQFDSPAIWLEPHSNDSQKFIERAGRVIQTTNKLLELSGLENVAVVQFFKKS